MIIRTFQYLLKSLIFFKYSSSAKFVNLDYPHLITDANWQQRSKIHKVCGNEIFKPVEFSRDNGVFILHMLLRQVYDTPETTVKKRCRRQRLEVIQFGPSDALYWPTTDVWSGNSRTWQKTLYHISGAKVRFVRVDRCGFAFEGNRVLCDDHQLTLTDMRVFSCFIVLYTLTNSLIYQFLE